MPVRRKLTVKFIESQEVWLGERIEIMDTQPSNMGVRINDKGRPSFFLLARFPDSRHPTRGALADHGETLTLAEARDRALEWKAALKRGEDPRHRTKKAKERKAAEATEAADRAFSAVVRAFKDARLVGPKPGQPLQRTGAATARELETVWGPALGSKTVDQITRADIVPVIRKLRAKHEASHVYNMYGHLRRCLKWAAATEEYGLSRSPCEGLELKQLIGPKNMRDRILTGSEQRAFWAATAELGYPYGPLFRVLLLSGQRLSEIGDMHVREIDRDKALLVIPAARMKGKIAHTVPLVPAVTEILDKLPKFKPAGYVFSTKAGRVPVAGYSKAKRRLDELMLAEMRKAAVEREEEPADVNLAGWTLHDLRRTMRSGLSAVPMQDLVRELVIAHARPELQRRYDLHAYDTEKRKALEEWATKLLGIVEPPPDNVVRFARSASAA